MQFLLDTSTCVFFLRGKLNLEECKRSVGAAPLFISIVTQAELLFGAERSQDPVKNYLRITNVLRSMEVLPVEPFVNRFAIEKARLFKLGVPHHDNFDLLIAATALENNLTLVTDNVRHFEKFDSLIIQNWYHRP